MEYFVNQSANRKFRLGLIMVGILLIKQNDFEQYICLLFKCQWFEWQIDSNSISYKKAHMYQIGRLVNPRLTIWYPDLKK